MASVHVVRGYDLRYSVAEKTIDASNTTKWTAFVNNRHTLCHLVPNGGEVYMRIPLYFSLKGATDSYLRRVIMGKVGHCIDA